MCVFLMADLGETTAFLLPSRRHLSQNRPPAHQNELGTSVGDLPCEACRRFPAGNMRTYVQVSPSQGHHQFSCQLENQELRGRGPPTKDQRIALAASPPLEARGADRVLMACYPLDEAPLSEAASRTRSSSILEEGM